MSTNDQIARVAELLHREFETRGRGKLLDEAQPVVDHYVHVAKQVLNAAHEPAPTPFTVSVRMDDEAAFTPISEADFTLNWEVRYANRIPEQTAVRLTLAQALALTTLFLEEAWYPFILIERP